jgi:hypothetical protein
MQSQDTVARLSLSLSPFFRSTTVYCLLDVKATDLICLSLPSLTAVHLSPPTVSLFPDSQAKHWETWPLYKGGDPPIMYTATNSQEYDYFDSQHYGSLQNCKSHTTSIIIFRCPVIGSSIRWNYYRSRDFCFNISRGQLGIALASYSESSSIKTIVKLYP